MLFFILETKFVTIAHDVDYVGISLGKIWNYISIIVALKFSLRFQLQYSVYLESIQGTECQLFV